MKIIGDYEYEWFPNNLDGVPVNDELRNNIMKEIEEKCDCGWESVVIAPIPQWLFRRKIKRQPSIVEGSKLVVNCESVHVGQEPPETDG